MATNESEKHARLSIILLKGGTKITRRLLEKRIVQLTPIDHTHSPWTVDEFLLANKEKILKTKQGREKEKKYFPGVIDKTNLDHWDLNMFCHILLESADINREVRMDINELRKLRNKLCHLNEPSLEIDKYNKYLDKIEVIFERTLKVIGDSTFENEISDMLKSIKEGPLSLDFALRQMKTFYMMEGETKEILSVHTKDHEAMLNKLDTIIEQTKPKEDAIQLPDTDVEILVKNCNSDKERRLSEYLVQLIDENIHKHTDLPKKLPNESFSKLREAVAEAVRTLLSNGRQITNTEKKCVLLRIKCLSLTDLVNLFRDCVNGRLNQQLKPIETAVKQIPEFEDVILEAVIYEEEFWNVMEKTISAVDGYVSASTRKQSKVTLGQSQSCNGTVHTVRLTIPTETDRQLKELKRCFESGNVEKITKDIEQAACEELKLTDVSIEARLLDKEIEADRQEIQVERKYKQFAVKSRKKNFKHEARQPIWKRLQNVNQQKLILFDFKTRQSHSKLEDNGFEERSQQRECSLKVSEDSGIGSDIYASSSLDESLSEVQNQEQLSIISSDDNQSFPPKSDLEDNLSNRDFLKIEPTHTSTTSEEELDEYIVRYGIKLNESFLTQVRSKSSKRSAFYQEFKSPEELKNLIALDPKRYVPCIIHVESSHEAYCNPTTKDAGVHLNRIEISGRSKIGQVYNEDEVVVELLDSKQKCERRFGQVIGVLKRHRCKKENIKHPVFLCTPDNADSHIVRPMCKTVPKIHVMHDKIMQQYNTKKSSRYKIEIYEYDENAEILCNSRIETLSQAEFQSCVFLVAIISWELNQIYPKGAIIKRFPLGETVKSGLNILNLRYEVTKMFSNETMVELERLRENNVDEHCSASVDLEENLIQDKSDLRCFTIDRREAHDLNLAISIEKLTDTDCHKVGVHIIDVSAYIQKGSPLDKAAFRRAFTIRSNIDTPRYMFPEDIAVKLCSLHENEKKQVISIYLFLQGNGKYMQSTKRIYQIERSIIKCCRNFSYEEAEEVAQGNGRDELTQDMKCLFQLMRSARKSRLRRSKNILSNNEIWKGNKISIEAQCVAEELTVMVNKKVAELMIRNNITIPLFTQKPPSSKDLESYCDRFGDFLNILVHLQNKKITPSLELMVENVLSSDVGQHRSLDVMLFDSVWQNIKTLSPTVADSILDDSLHPIQFVIYTRWHSIQKHPRYICSIDSIESADKEHFGLGFERYTHCTFPTRRYSDLVVQRMLHHYLKKQEVPYNKYEIKELCEHMNDLSLKMCQYQRDCTSLQKGLALTNQEKMQKCFVTEMSEQSLIVTDKPESLSNYQDFELLCNILDMGYKPEILEDIKTNLKQLKGKWRKRLYDLRNQKPEVSLMKKENDSRQELSGKGGNSYFQSLNPNVDVTFIKLQQWARLVKNAADNKHDDLKRNIKRVDPWKTTEGDKDVSTECIDILKIEANTKFSFMFHFGQPLNIQMHAKPSNGVISPRPMLFEMTDNVKLCLQHIDDPILHLCKYSTRPSLDQYRDWKEYTSIWLPIVLMEAAVSAISNEEGCTINNVEVKVLNEREGTFMLPVEFCEERNIDFSGSRNRRIEEGDLGHTFDWLCIKSKVPSCHQSRKESKTRSMQNVWVGHSEVSEVKLEKKKIDDELQEVYIISFKLHANSRTFQSHESKSNAINCSIEILRKTDVDRRIESALRTLNSRTDVLALDVALKRKLKPLDEDHFRQANFIERDLCFDARDLDPHSKPLPRNNQKQQEAIDMALRNRFTLIQGPPGTGKSYTGIKLIYLFNKINDTLQKRGIPKKQVLFCGPSNKSVDLVAKCMLRRLGKKCPDFLRIYGKATEAEDFPIPGVSFQSRGSKIHKADKDLRSVTLHFLIRDGKNEYSGRILRTEKEFERYRDQGKKPRATKIKEYLKLLSKASAEEIKKHEVLLCTTSFSSNPKLLTASRVSQVIIDEAGMCPEPQCMVPLIATRAEQIVMIGDHKQLRPIVKSKAAAELGLDKSLFERYATTKNKIGSFIMLHEQYRMNPQLCQFPSEQFYQGQLETKDGLWVNDKISVWQKDAVGNVYPHILIHVEGEENVLTVNTDYGSEQSRSNTKEIDVVIKVYRFFVEENISPEKINVISQYNAQCNEMKERLEKEGFTNYVVNTVVSSQGGEWDYVIFSTVRSLPEYKIELNSTIGWRKHNLGFITDTNQINVALTRARKGLILIGNKNLLSCDPIWKKLISHYEQRKCVKLASEFPPRRTRQDMIRQRMAHQSWDKTSFKSTGAIPKRR